LFRGNFQVFRGRGGTLVVQKWPRKRGPKCTAKQQQARDDFINSVRMIKTPCEYDFAASYERAPGTDFLPRDLLMLATFGKIVSANLANGTKVIGVRILADQVQQLLNRISMTPGTLIMRNATDWVALLPGNSGDVLTSTGSGSLPIWSQGGGGSGGGAWMAPMSAPQAANFTTVSTDLPTTLTDQGNGAVLATTPSGTALDEVQWCSRAVPAMGPHGWSATLAITPCNALSDTGFVGLMIKKAASPRMRIFGQDNARSLAAIINYNSWNSYNGQTALRQAIQPVFWQRLAYDGTNLIWAQSLDGYFWQTVLIENAANSFVGVPDQIGFAANFSSDKLPATQAASPAGVVALSWTESSS
jgi:hypothetical protein